MAALVSPERLQSPQRFIKTEDSFSDCQPGEEASKEGECLLNNLGLPQLTSNLEWPVMDNDSAMEPYVNFPTVEFHEDCINVFHSSSTPLCTSTPDIQRQVSDCYSEQLSTTTQITPSEKSISKNRHKRSSTYTSHLSSQSQAGLSSHTRSKSLSTDHTGKLIQKRIICDFEKDLTFRPTLNEHSMRLASKKQRNSVPLVHRLLEARRSIPDPYEHRLTFAPKLNPASLKLAQERATKMSEVRVC